MDTQRLRTAHLIQFLGGGEKKQTWKRRSEEKKTEAALSFWLVGVRFSII